MRKKYYKFDSYFLTVILKNLFFYTVVLVGFFIFLIILNFIF
jgi:hypothetical protein